MTVENSCVLNQVVVVRPLVAANGLERIGHDVKPRRTLVLKPGLILEGGQQGAVPYLRINGRLTQCYHQ